jgi:hypothetical protein
MIYFAQINNKWAASTLIILFVKMFEFSKILSFEEKTFVKENKETFEIFRNISFFIRNILKK